MFCLAHDFASNVADDPAQPCAQDAQFTPVAVELFGMGVASRHHSRALGDAQIGLPQPHTVLAGQAVQSLDRRVQQLGIGRERDGLGLNRGVDRDPLEISGPQRTALVSNPQAFGQQQLKLVAQPLAPMAQVRAFVRELVLEELLPGEVLKIRVMDPALADALVGQPVECLSNNSPITNRVSLPGRPLSL